MDADLKVDAERIEGFGLLELETLSLMEESRAAPRSGVVFRVQREAAANIFNKLLAMISNKQDNIEE